MISEAERQRELRLAERFHKRLKKFVGKSLTPALQTRMMAALVEEIGHELQERKVHMNPRRVHEIEDALTSPPRHGQDETAMMKDVGSGNMEVAVNAIHLLSGELKQKSNAINRVVGESEGLRNHLYQRTATLAHVVRILDAVLTSEGQTIVRRLHGLKPDAKKKLVEANRKELVKLREYLAEQKI